MIQYFDLVLCNQFHLEFTQNKKYVSLENVKQDVHYITIRCTTSKGKHTTPFR